MKETPTRCFQLTLTPSEKAVLRRLAKFERCSMRELLRRLLREAARGKQTEKAKEEVIDAP